MSTVSCLFIINDVATEHVLDFLSHFENILEAQEVRLSCLDALIDLELVKEGECLILELSFKGATFNN